MNLPPELVHKILSEKFQIDKKTDLSLICKQVKNVIDHESFKWVPDFTCCDCDKKITKKEYQILHDNHGICSDCVSDCKNMMSIMDTNLFNCPSKGCKRMVFGDI